jgi:riboflavin transporter FmnP
MNTKKLALTIVFAALTIALNPSLTYIAINAPFAPNLIYQIWEIPIVVAFLIISPIAGVAISLLNTAVLFVVFPGALPTGPVYNLAAALSMQIGIFVAWAIARKFYHANTDTDKLFNAKTTALATGFGIITRVAFMSIVLLYALPQPSPIGFSFPIEATIAYLPLAAIFNATLALYTIPIGFLIAKRVKKVLHLTISNERKTENNKKENEKLEA